ncbi:hypothetical protein [Plantactinospora sp. KLBMP9567]|uniref:MmyB family transcriptional regulator n=1 Tax=Plantactinospora sp. KLBMP9567 TaxID=3085900 RepID=UPI002981337C|nr:hypothetical protein [Plantactinospora sp. KLBMP9567]MDW5327099.1 hypothetical protein [Plantactinospora sp. KLBMP9567]
MRSSRRWRAFEFAAAERDHLFRLAGELPPEPESPGAEIRPGFLRLLRTLDDTMPVSIHDGRLDMVAYNAAAAELFGQLSATGRFRRNIVYQCFTAVAVTEVLGEDGVEELARVSTAELRSALSRPR